MQGSGDYLGGLVQLHRLETDDDRRTTWRQSVASLARIVSESPALPLEGFSPETLVPSVRVALDSGLVDDMGFLSEAAAALALYELASALPHGPERREMGRLVFERLTSGDAATFVALATQLAAGSTKALSGAPTRARVALCLDLPLGDGAPADALALALVSRPDLERDWLTVPSTGALPSRRLAARLLERAARETVRRAGGGDDSGVRVFDSPSVQDAWSRLLADRESLVWRHVAVARGLLAEVVPRLADEVGRHLDPHLSPTEWRRAAASVAAMVASRPEAALARGRRIIAGKLLKLDAGVAAAMILGLPRAAEAEPDAAEELLETCIAFGGVDAFEALVDLRRERIGRGFGLGAARLAEERVREILAEGTHQEVDDGEAALMDALLVDLGSSETQGELTLRDRLLIALGAFASEGAGAAYAEAELALEAAEDALTRLEGFRPSSSLGRRRAFRALRELDMGLLETSTLQDLLLLGAKGQKVERATAPLDALFDRLTAVLLDSERASVPEGERVAHRTLRLRRLRAMLHLVDADGGLAASRSAGLRARRLATARVLLGRAREDAPSVLSRTVCAAAARACDALVREEVVELSDVVIATATYLVSEEQQTTLSEASMVPEIEAVARAYAAVVGLCHDSEDPWPPQRTIEALRALVAVAHALPLASSRRVEALRAALLAFAGSLEAIASAPCLRAVTEGADPRPLGQVEAATRSLALLVSGARRRLGAEEGEGAAGCAAAVRLIDFAVERALRGSREPMREAIGTAEELLAEDLPEAMASVAARALGTLGTLPVEAERAHPLERTAKLSMTAAAPLPPWLPPGRLLGGFHVVRALGAGGAASVFVVRRVEDRHDEGGETFALKVPAYDGSAARALSEAQFLQLFRDEAGALLAVPAHPNLARFVTFDAGAKPKPILVMELVEGATLERVLALGDLDMAAALSLLDGIAAGLEAMHSVGVGHLDLKPSNVILRDPDGAGPAPAAPVLVDFGLSGRSIRPGCGTPNYAAPEIWGLVPRGVTPTPMATDVYALGCLGCELLTGRSLFEGTSIGAIKALHVAHDGEPEGVSALGGDEGTAPLARLLRAMLRQDPRGRVPATTVREVLAQVKSSATSLAWPLRMS